MPSPPVPTTLMNDLRRLGLLRTAEDLNDILARATRLRWSPTVLLEHIVTAELEERRRRSIERRLTAARLGRFKPIADWDWDWPTALDRPALERVLALDFLDRAENVLLVGAQGLGKTMLAKNIVHQVVLAGHSARFITASDLLLDLNGQETARALERRLRHYARPALLAIDEIGYLAYDAPAADLLFQIVSRRYEHRPLLMTVVLQLQGCDVRMDHLDGKHRTGSPIMPSDNPFKWRQFEPALILQCVRWYLRYALSYRDLEDMMRERGLCVDHTTIYRWVQRYAPEIDKRCRPFLRRTNDSYRIDETYVRVAGAWTYLYRGVDSNGDTLDFLLRATRDRKAAIAFFRKTLGAAHTTPPRVVTVDKNPAYPVAFEAVRHEGLVRPRSNLRQCKYLNNIIEQDHRFIKRRTRPMLGFKRFTTAWRTLRGIEIMHALRKGQARWMAKGDVVGQTQLIHKVFGLAA